MQVKMVLTALSYAHNAHALRFIGTKNNRGIFLLVYLGEGKVIYCTGPDAHDKAVSVAAAGLVVCPLGEDVVVVSLVQVQPVLRGGKADAQPALAGKAHVLGGSYTEA